MKGTALNLENDFTAVPPTMFNKELDVLEENLIASSRDSRLVWKYLCPRASSTGVIRNLLYIFRVTSGVIYDSISTYPMKPLPKRLEGNSKL